MSERKEMRSVEVTIMACDLCGSERDIARYECNRRCAICRRTICNSCVGDFVHETRCKICDTLAGKWIPIINAAYQEYERVQDEWKKESLASGKP